MKESYTVLSQERSTAFRSRYMSQFVLSYEQQLERIQRINPEWMQAYSKERYKQDYLWNRATDDFSEIPFEQALQELRNHRFPVYFMTEGKEFRFQDRYFDFTDAVAKGDGALLADEIESGWHELGKRRNPDVIPLDLYVFDNRFSQVIIFTHETNAKGGRYCLVKA